MGRYTLLVVRGQGLEPRELQPGERLRIGRHASNDLVIPEHQVSRFHASIVWEPAKPRPVVVDHKSANRMRVNGLTVESKVLDSGDVVEIGSFRLEIELQGEPGGVTTASGEELSQFLLESHELELFGDQGPDQFEGVIHGAACIHRVLFDLENGGRTGTLKMVLDGCQAQVTICLGKIAAARFEEEQGRSALERIVSTRAQGSYQFSKGFRPAEEFLDLSVRDVLDRFTSHSRTGRLPRMSAAELEADRSEPVSPGELMGGFVGDQLSGILQILGLNGRTGSLQLEWSSGRGALFFREGNLVGAELAGVTGREAAYAALKLPRGRFKFVPALPPEGKQFPPVQVTSLLLEGMRQRDELGQ